MKPFYFFFALTLFVSCNNNKPAEQPAVKDSIATPDPKTEATPDLPDLPPGVVYKNWKVANPQHLTLVTDVYKAWDSDNVSDMEQYFADSATIDLPDGTRLTTTKATVEARFRKWRNLFKETANTPFSLISLHNDDENQDWVITWVWNKWRNNNGVKDSMLFCDNWQIRDNKIVYMNSLQNRGSKPLARLLNEKFPQK